MSKIDQIREALVGYIVDEWEDVSYIDRKITQFIGFRIGNYTYCVSVHNNKSIYMNDSIRHTCYAGFSVENCISAIEKITGGIKKQ